MSGTIPVVDVGNPFLGPDYPGQLALGRMTTPFGERLCLTIRCGPATVSVMLPRDAAKQWAAQISEAADGMSGLIVPNGVVIPKEPGR